ncbi:hypothetical protein Zm00014a_026129 [Zea mays]|uniref:Uncharacterized protein n=1 Tax=Zea mays TaxID=4577 RepID=A0A3L6FKX8_MAIZE|nr:hypothetical protein Zm00014a_026129 [Zea mays]
MESWTDRVLERVVAPAQPTDVGEQPDELLLVRQVRTPPAAAASTVISQLMRHAACLAAAASFIHFLVTPTRTKRIRNGGEEHELLLAVAVAAADEAVADAAPAEDGARGAALPAPARGRGRRRLPAGRPQAVALRRHALQGSGGANREGGRSGGVTLTVWDGPNQGVRRDGYGTGSFRDAGRWAASRNRDHDSVGNSEGSWGAVG